MRGIIVVLLAIAAPTLLAPPSNASANTNEHFCAHRWPNDSKKKWHCVDAQTTGAKKVWHFKKIHSIDKKLIAYLEKGAEFGPYLKIFRECTERWTVDRFETFDYVEFAHCLDQKETEYIASQKNRRQKDDPDPPGDRLEDKLSPME